MGLAVFLCRTLFCLLFTAPEPPLLLLLLLLPDEFFSLLLPEEFFLVKNSSDDVDDEESSSLSFRRLSNLLWAIQPEVRDLGRPLSILCKS